MKSILKVAAGLGMWALVITIATLAFLYGLSIPRPWFEPAEGMSAETIQSGPIRAIWIAAAAEERKGYYYVHVVFLDNQERKCTLSTVGLRKLPSNEGPFASICRVQYPGDDSWKFIAMNVELPYKQYWELRRAGWPLWGNLARREIRIVF